MKLPSFRYSLACLGILVFTSSGCQMHRSPGSMLPSLAANKHDRAIEKYAESSGFPTPEQVGLTMADSQE